MGRGKGTPNSVVEQGCTHTKIILDPYDLARRKWPEFEFRNLQLVHVRACAPVAFFFFFFLLRATTFDFRESRRFFMASMDHHADGHKKSVTERVAETMGRIGEALSIPKFEAAEACAQVI